MVAGVFGGFGLCCFYVVRRVMVVWCMGLLFSKCLCCLCVFDVVFWGGWFGVLFVVVCVTNCFCLWGSVFHTEVCMFWFLVDCDA